MKRVGNLWERVVSFPNLLLAARADFLLEELAARLEDPRDILKVIGREQRVAAVGIGSGAEVGRQQPQLPRPRPDRQARRHHLARRHHARARPCRAGSCLARPVAQKMAAPRGPPLLRCMYRQAYLRGSRTVNSPSPLNTAQVPAMRT